MVLFGAARESNHKRFEDILKQIKNGNRADPQFITIQSDAEDNLLASHESSAETSYRPQVIGKQYLP